MGKRKALLIDLDGTIYKGKDPIPYAAEFVSEARKRGFPLLFVTNNSSRTPQAVAAQLRSLDIPAESGEVVTASQAAARYLTMELNCRRVYCIGESGLTNALSEAGLELCSTDPDAVVQGIDRSFDYGKLEAAVRFIREGAAYILTNPDVLLPSDSGLLPGAGTIAASIRVGSGKEPVIIGKPSRIIMDFALEKAGCTAAEAWVIGDNLHTDIAAGKAAGCRTALVLTGVTTRDNIEEQIRLSGVRADIAGEKLTDLLPLLE